MSEITPDVTSGVEVDLNVNGSGVDVSLDIGGDGPGAGASAFAELTDVDWPYADGEAAVYDSGAGEMVGRPAPQTIEVDAVGAIVDVSVFLPLAPFQVQTQTPALESRDITAVIVPGEKLVCAAYLVVNGMGVPVSDESKEGIYTIPADPAVGPWVKDTFQPPGGSIALVTHPFNAEDTVFGESMRGVMMMHLPFINQDSYELPMIGYLRQMVGQLSGREAVTGSVTIGDFVGNVFITSGTGTVTLPRAIYTDGRHCTIINDSGSAWTIAPIGTPDSGSDFWDQGATSATISVADNQTVVVVGRKLSDTQVRWYVASRY